MNGIELNPNQIIRIGKYPSPNVPNYNSLFFHPLTKGNETRILYDWGHELTKICVNENIQYYYFFNDFDKKINVYPNSLIEDWWAKR